MNSAAVRQYCTTESKPCLHWAEKFFGDCLCNLRDDLSFTFGFISLLCWGIAEVPQIITNFRTKSGHGISLLFLLTWIAGDIFNLVGCLIEPATLPTQLYTAVMYTATTIVLVLQSVYYDHFRKWKNHHERELNQEVEDVKKPLRPQKQTDSSIPIPKATSGREAYYYTSARSMAGSMTPPIRSHLWPIKSGPSALEIEHDSSSEDDENPNPTMASVSRPKPIPRSVGYGSFMAASLTLPRETNALAQAYIGLSSGRKLLQEHGSESVFGQSLGWMMAAIYMTGRVPQIWLNIKRGSVEGLNPLMFVFAIFANATYVASIVVRSVEWDKIKPNMPWLLDAVACVVLDLFVSFSALDVYMFVVKGEP